MSFYVYAYLDPRKGGNFVYGDHKFEYEPFYIGKGKEGSEHKRHLSHLKMAKKNDYLCRKSNKINSIKNETGKDPIIILLVEGIETEEEAWKIEENLIFSIKRYEEGGPLTNITKGGSGGDTLLNHPNKEQILAKMSQSQNDFWASEISNGLRKEKQEKSKGSGNPFFGKHHSDAVKNKLSKERKSIPMKQEIKEKISKTLKYKYSIGERVPKEKSPELIKKLSDRMKNDPVSKRPEVKEKIRQSVTGGGNPSAIGWIFNHFTKGEFFVFGEFQKFCKDNNLPIKIMRTIANNTRKDKNYNGWTVKRAT